MAQAVIGEAITARNYASKKDRAEAANRQRESVYTMAASFLETAVTKGIIYNATGDTIKFVKSKDWNEQVQTSYPREIENGQGGLFVHTTRQNVDGGSKGAVVYRAIKDGNGNESDWMCSWKNAPETDQSSTHAYTEIREVNHFKDNEWPAISERTDKASRDSTDTELGFSGKVSITEGSPAKYKACITLQN